MILIAHSILTEQDQGFIIMVYYNCVECHKDFSGSYCPYCYKRFIDQKSFKLHSLEQEETYNLMCNHPLMDYYNQLDFHSWKWLDSDQKKQAKRLQQIQAERKKVYPKVLSVFDND